MNAEQTTGRVWNRRRTEKQRRLAGANIPGKVIPTDQLVSVLENLLAPGDRVVLEGNNQKQADFLSRSLAEVNPQIVHDLHMIMPSVGRSEHLDILANIACLLDKQENVDHIVGCKTADEVYELLVPLNETEV